MPGHDSISAMDVSILGRRPIKRHIIGTIYSRNTVTCRTITTGQLLQKNADVAN